MDAVRAGVDRVLVPGIGKRLGVALDVGALHDQQQPLASLEPGAGGENLDLGLDDPPARDRERAAVGEDGQELRAELWVRLTVGGSQPAGRCRAVLELRVVREPDSLAVPYFTDSPVASLIDEFTFLDATVARRPSGGRLVEASGLWRPVWARVLLWERGGQALEQLRARVHP